MIAVRDIVLIRHARNDTESLLQAFGKLIGGGLHRRSVYGITDMLRFPPFFTLIIQTLHNSHRKGPCLRISVGSCQACGHTSHTDRHNQEKWWNSRYISSLSMVSPFFRRASAPYCHRIGATSEIVPSKTLMTASKRTVAQLQVAPPGSPRNVSISPSEDAGHIYQIDRNNALIETCRRTCDLPSALRWAVLHGQEGTASHAGIYFALFQFLHNLGRNIIRNHTLRCTSGGQLRQIPVLGIFCDIILVQHIDQLRERRCDPYALFILNALHALLQHFLDDQRKIISRLPLRNLIQIHENRHKWSLTVTGHQSDQLILNRLDTAA